MTAAEPTREPGGEPTRKPGVEPTGEPHGDATEEALASDEMLAPLQPIRRTPNRKAAAMIAAGMFAIDDLLGKKRREEAPIVVDASGEPVDIDADGIEVRVANVDGDEVAVAAPALPRSRPVTPSRPSRRRGGRSR